MKRNTDPFSLTFEELNNLPKAGQFEEIKIDETTPFLSGKSEGYSFDVAQDNINYGYVDAPQIKMKTPAFGRGERTYEDTIGSYLNEYEKGMADKLTQEEQRQQANALAMSKYGKEFVYGEDLSTQRTNQLLEGIDAYGRKFGLSKDEIKTLKSSVHKNNLFEFLKQSNVKEELGLQDAVPPLVPEPAATGAGGADPNSERSPMMSPGSQRGIKSFLPSQITALTDKMRENDGVMEFMSNNFVTRGDSGVKVKFVIRDAFQGDTTRADYPQEVKQILRMIEQVASSDVNFGTQVSDTEGKFVQSIVKKCVIFFIDNGTFTPDGIDREKISGMEEVF